VPAHGDDEEEERGVVSDPRTAAGNGPYARLRRGLDLLDDTLVGIGSLMLFALMCIVVADVSMRYFLNSPLHWSFDVISNYLMPGLFFLAVSHTLKAHSHVAVDIVHNYVGTKTRYAFESIGSILAVPAFAICTWNATAVTVNDFQTGATATSGLPIPTWTVSLFLPLGFGLLTLRLVLNAAGYVLSLVRSRPVLELPPISGTEEGAE
jgi:TRAP-type C4-dicarboxylate transport system permease small subunit